MLSSYKMENNVKYKKLYEAMNVKKGKKKVEKLEIITP